MAFLRITDPLLRQSIHALSEEERILTAEPLGERGSESMRIKVAGILECAELIVASLTDGQEKYIFARDGFSITRLRHPEYVVGSTR